MKSNSVFVPGKVILAGEHAVVYGKMALVASIGLGVHAKVVKDRVFEKTEIVKKAIEAAGGDEKLQVKIESDLPIGSGFGSSAAVAAATILAVRNYLGKPIDKDELFKLTMECEKIAHGNPSGIDPAAVVYGGLISYRKGEPIEHLQIKKPISLLLLDSGKPKESTKEMVEMVAQNPNKEKIIEEIGELVGQVKSRLENGEDISGLLNKNGLLLEELGVVGTKAEKISQALRGTGASVKITGAGGVQTGSGMMMVIGGDLVKVKKMLDNSRIKYLETVIGAK